MKPVQELAEHWVRIHRPFSHPKQWVKGPFDALDFTDNQSACDMYTLTQAKRIIEDFHARWPGFCVKLDGV